MNLLIGFFFKNSFIYLVQSKVFFFFNITQSLKFVLYIYIL